MEEDNILEYKNLYLFYEILYNRTFDLINILIDESTYDIYKIKTKLIDFLDWYSYYLIQKKLIEKDDLEEKESKIIEKINNFSNFYKELNKYPSQNFLVSFKNYKGYDLDKSKLSNKDFYILNNEYYNFFDDVLEILRQFIKITSESGFFPQVKNKANVKNIGYANHDKFFKLLEELKSKISEITTQIDIINSFKSRRAINCLLIIFSPYFNNKNIIIDLLSKLNFNFVNNEDTMNKIKTSMYYEYYLLPQQLKKELDIIIIIPLRENISISKRLISYEFGEKDMSPRLKKKYNYDPTGV
jgi:hypothetical protein